MAIETINSTLLVKFPGQINSTNCVIEKLCEVNYYFIKEHLSLIHDNNYFNELSETEMIKIFKNESFYEKIYETDFLSQCGIFIISKEPTSGGGLTTSSIVVMFYSAVFYLL